MLLFWNTNVHSIALGVPLLGLFAWDVLARRESRRGPAFIGLMIAIAGALLALIQLIPPPDGQLPGLSGALDLTWVHISLTAALLPTLEGGVPWAIAAALLFAAVAISVAPDARALTFLLASTGSLWAIFVLKYAGSPRHWGFLLLAILVALWIRSRHEEIRANVSARPRASPWRGVLVAAASRLVALGLPMALAWSTFVAALFWHRDIRDPFSGSKAMADFLVRQRLTELPIAAWPAPHAESLLPYLPVERFYYPGIRSEGSHMLWNRAYAEGLEISHEELLRRVEEAFPGERDVLLLLNRPLTSAPGAGFELIHAEIGNMIMGDEQYFLYRRRPSSS